MSVPRSQTARSRRKSTLILEATATMQDQGSTSPSASNTVASAAQFVPRDSADTRLTYTEAAKPREQELKLTLWRFINSCILLGFGTAKAILAYQGSSAVNTLDMALGLIWAFISYWCGLIETDYPKILPWLFEHDILPLFIVPFWGFAFGILISVIFLVAGVGTTQFYPRNEPTLAVQIALTAVWIVASVISVALAGGVIYLALRMAMKIPVHGLLDCLSYDNDWNPTAIRESLSWLKVLPICFSCLVVFGFAFYCLLELAFLYVALPIPWFIILLVIAISIGISITFVYVVVGFLRMISRLSRGGNPSAIPTVHS